MIDFRLCLDNSRYLVMWSFKTFYEVEHFNILDSFLHHDGGLCSADGTEAVS